MLKVICNQRDRFRARLRETEEVFCFLKIFTFGFLSLFDIVTVRSLDQGFTRGILLGNKTVEGEDRGTYSGTGKDKS